MSLISGFLQGAQAPPKQLATTTIQTLCLRLSSATLLEDRRAAILGLRSFARDYQELVASEGLRELIATLKKDREDLDTAKAVLETLLMLFEKQEANPESSEDIALWLTDEFTQKQENITLLLDLLEDADFYIRLHTIQLLAEISKNRPARTQECVFTAPLGVSRLVSILEDKRDAIRDQAVLLTIHLSDGHTDIQKLITFEGTFDHCFTIIEQEGGVDGGIVVQDCLQLMSNLLSYNVSNQNYFRETGFVPKLAKLLTLSEEELNPFAKDQRDTNIQYALRLVRLFVVPGGLGTAANQNALVATGILHLVIQIAFLSSCGISVRAQALKAVADLIDGNEALQHSFAQIQVALPHLQPPPGAEEGGEENGEAHCGVIEALLDLALWDNTVGNIDNRFAACRCLEAYFNGNSPVRTFFLKHAIQLHTEADESPNAITSLLHLDPAARGDPYRVWIASVIMIHLIHDDTEAKIMATEMREGDAEAGEEVVTAIQSCSANLITALQHQYDTRICIGYLMLLCMWLYGDSDAVDDFLSETSSVQALVGAVKENGVDPIVQGLSTFLLGILYEFSHRDSPVTRTHLHQLLATQMTRDLYVNKITQLRSNPLIRDFEVSKDDLMPGHHRRKHGLPEVYFDQVFIEFLKENYGNVLRAIDKAPELDTRVSGNGIVKTSNGVNLEELEDLRKQLAIKTEELEQIETARQKEKTLMEQQHSASLQRIEDARYKDLETIKAAQTSALAEAEKARRAAEQQLQTAQTSGKRARDALAAEQKKSREEIEKIRQAAAEEKAKSDDNFRKVAQDMTERNRRTVEEKENQLKALREQIKEIPGLKRGVEERAEKLDNMRRQAEELVKRTNEIVAEREGRIKELNEALREAGQREQGLKQQINQATKETAEVKKQLDAEAKNSEQMIQQSDAEIQKLTASIQQLQNQLQEAQNQIQQAHAETKRVRDEMQQQLVIKASAEKCLQDSTAMVARKNKEIEERQQQAEAAQKVVKEKEEKIKFLEDTAAAERKHADQRIKELEKAVESSKKDSEAEKKKLDAKIKELEKKTEEARKKTEAAQKAADEDQQQLIEAQEAAKKQAAELKEQDKSADAAKLAALEKEKEALQKQLSEASKAQEVAKKQAAELEKEKSADAAKLAALEKEKEELQKQLTEASEAATKVAALEEANKKLTALEGAQEKLKAVSAEKEEAKKKAEEVQQELDDLFMVLGDLEEKRKADKKRLKELGAEVSDDEDEDEDEDGDEDEEE